MEIQEAISTLATKAKDGDATEALKYSQAALNLAHVMSIKSQTLGFPRNIRATSAKTI